MKRGIVGAIFALLFLWSTLASAGVVVFNGFETGSFGQWTIGTGSPTVATDQTGFGMSGYSEKITDGAAGAFITSPTGLNLSTAYVRVNYYSNAVNSDVGSQPLQVIQYQSSTPTNIAYVKILGGANSSGTLALQLFNGSSQIGSNFTISASAWHVIEVELVISATVGVLELKVDGSVVATGSNLNTGSLNIDRILVGQVNAAATFTGNTWFDDFILRDDAYPGYGYSIARQGAIPSATATPTYNSWTKSSGTDCAPLWSETPFSATKNCSSTSTSAGTAQTMFMGNFSTAGNAQEGTGIIGSGDTINAAMTALVGKVTASATANSIATRRRVAGSNTDTNCANSTTDAFCGGTIWTPSFANLSDGTTEIGAVDNDLVSTKTAQVEDVWEMVDYQPTVTPTATPTATPTPAPPTPTPTAIPSATPTPQASGCVPSAHMGWKGGLYAGGCP